MSSAKWRTTAGIFAILALGILPSQAGVIEGFESGPSDLANYTTAGGANANASIVGGAAHDGAFGLQFGGLAGSPDWYYRNDATVHVTQGESISAWMSLGDAIPGTPSVPGTNSGRLYFGFGASAAGTLSAVLAPNTGQFMLQNNSGYGFSMDAAVNQSYLADHWYLVDVLWGIGGSLTAQLFDSDGTTLLNAVTANDNTFTSGGIAFRGFSAAPDKIDTICVNGCGTQRVPEPMTLSIFGFGIAGLISARRRKNKST